MELYAVPATLVLDPRAGVAETDRLTELGWVREGAGFVHPGASARLVPRVDVAGLVVLPCEDVRPSVRAELAAALPILTADAARARLRSRLPSERSLAIPAHVAMEAVDELAAIERSTSDPDPRVADAARSACATLLGGLADGAREVAGCALTAQSAEQLLWSLAADPSRASRLRPRLEHVHVAVAPIVADGVFAASEARWRSGPPSFVPGIDLERIRVRVATGAMLRRPGEIAAAFGAVRDVAPWLDPVVRFCAWRLVPPPAEGPSVGAGLAWVDDDVVWFDDLVGDIARALRGP